MLLSPKHLQSVRQLHRLIETVDRIILGKSDITTLTLTAMLAGGHVLFEDIPGVGKTMLVRTIAACLGTEFSRIQFTPDLLPSDIIGFSIPHPERHEFEFRKGPIFSSLVLADEINRTSPRTQAAMLEAMSEQQVTMDGISYPLPEPFFVLATQNPIEYEGTYPLPEAQLDRFLMQLSLGYPSHEQEVQMLKLGDQSTLIQGLIPMLSVTDFLELKGLVPEIHLQSELLEYIIQLGQVTRSDRSIRLGISPRGNQFCLAASKAFALLQGRDYVIPDDIQYILPSVYRHRLLFKEPLSAEQKNAYIQQVIRQVPVPSKRGGRR